MSDTAKKEPFGIAIERLIDWCESQNQWKENDARADLANARKLLEKLEKFNLLRLDRSTWFQADMREALNEVDSALAACRETGAQR